MALKGPAILISNPRAGQNQAARAAEVLRFCASLRRHGVAVEAVDTAGPGDATRLAEQAAAGGAGAVIISGGDGTVNEALQGLAGTRARLAVWPRGTANVLAREMGLPFNAEKLAEVIARGQTRRLYIGCATVEGTGEKRYFFLMAGVGLDASVVRRVDPRLKRRLGRTAFWLSGLGHLFHWRPDPFCLEVNGETYPATFAAIGKAPRYGGGLAITPHARLDQPEFELCIVDSTSRLRFLHLLAHAMRGGLPRNMAGAQLIRATRARATGQAPVQADGELIGQLPMTFEIVPQPIEVIAP
jgi:YegS/Rv2252/BmrU family lipid kinase